MLPLKRSNSLLRPNVAYRAIFGSALYRCKPIRHPCRTFNNDSKESNNRSKESENNNHYFSKALLTVLIPYTCYALFVSLKTNYEITQRENRTKGCDEEDFQSTLIKYSPLQILGRFENPFTEYRIQTVYEFFLNRVLEVFSINRGGIPSDKSLMRELMPTHKPTWTNASTKIDSKIGVMQLRVIGPDAPHKDTQSAPSNENIYTTWLGQSCAFIVYKGFKVLTDPLFSEYIVHETLGPKRITDLPCQIEDVPTPDVILVSHNHPDHLDFKSLEYWGSKRNRDEQPLWIVPKGLGPFLKQHKVNNFIELSWWETCELSTTKNNNTDVYEISCTPAMHWSGRSLVDSNQSLWCSFLFSDKKKPIFFHGGDTGYVTDLFRRIASRYGSGVKLALLPCGQYCPEWHQRPRHINPSEVLKIMKDLDAQTVLGVHWGTFVLSGESFREPKEKLEMLAEWKGLRENCYCPELGKTITVK